MHSTWHVHPSVSVAANLLSILMSAAAGVCNGLAVGTALTSLLHALTCGFVNAGANSQIPVSRNCFTRLRNLGEKKGRGLIRE